MQVIYIYNIMPQEFKLCSSTRATGSCQPTRKFSICEYHITLNHGYLVSFNQGEKKNELKTYSSQNKTRPQNYIYYIFMKKPYMAIPNTMTFNTTEFQRLKRYRFYSLDTLIRPWKLYTLDAMGSLILEVGLLVE